MPKKQKQTALRTPSHRKVSPNSKSGLIVTEKIPEHSAGTEYVLDNRSHRTTKRLHAELRFAWLTPARRQSGKSAESD